MTPPDLPSRRRTLGLLLSGLALAALPLGGERPWKVPMAWAGDDDHDEDDDDNSGPGSGDDRDGDDDNSGPGSRDDRDDDDRDEGPDDWDRDDDDRGGDEQDGDERDRDDSRDGPGRGREGGRPPRDITVLYPDGWTERIVGGRYELLDHQSRLVVRRAATAEDFGRMIALR